MTFWQTGNLYLRDVWKILHFANQQKRASKKHLIRHMENLMTKIGVVGLGQVLGVFFDVNVVHVKQHHELLKHFGVRHW
jgi:hypothetical protein